MTSNVELIGDKLGVQILGDRDIVFRNAERNFSITYRKVDLAQLLAAISVISNVSTRLCEILRASMESRMPNG